MRMLLQVHVDTDAGNQAISNGTLPKVIQGVIEQLHPESAYFYPDQGCRAAQFVFDMQDSSQIPLLVEPLLNELDAQVKLVPVMNLDDLQKGLTALTT